MCLTQFRLLYSELNTVDLVTKKKQTSIFSFPKLETQAPLSLPKVHFSGIPGRQLCVTVAMASECVKGGIFHAVTSIKS